MEKLSFQLRCKIYRVIENGFTALQDEYLIMFQDTKHKHQFYPSDEIILAVENSEPAQEELLKGYSVIYCLLKHYLANGIQFLDTSNQEKGFFWNYRGVLTNKLFENNDPWKKNSILRIMIRKI